MTRLLRLISPNGDMSSPMLVIIGAAAFAAMLAGFGGLWP
jgi:hypothetical protein